MNEEVITEYLCCPVCREANLGIDPLDRDGRDIRNAVVFCRACSAWYRVEDGLLELLVPSLRVPATDAAFRARFAKERGSWPYDNRPAHQGSDDHKLGQKAFYDEDAGSYETHMMQLHFWQSFDRRYTRTIREHTDRGGVMIEVGGGSGRQSIPLVGSFGTILSFDISESMVRRAVRRLSTVVPPDARGDVHYFVADAENIPIRSGCADAVIFSGILHHVAAPGVVIQETARVLRPGGRFVGMENNRTVLRPLFDWLMQLKRLWNEKAHPEHFIISGTQLRRWFADAGLHGKVWTSVFLPPHILSAVPIRAAEWLLVATDALGHSIPGLRNQGGLVLFAGEKPSGRVSSETASRANTSTAVRSA